MAGSVVTVVSRGFEIPMDTSAVGSGAFDRLFAVEYHRGGMAGTAVFALTTQQRTSFFAIDDNACLIGDDWFLGCGAPTDSPIGITRANIRNNANLNAVRGCLN